MESFTNYLLLLIANLSQRKNKQNITKLFIEGLNSFLPCIGFSWRDKPGADSTLMVSTRNKTYGEIVFDKPDFQHNKRKFVLLQNAAQMLAVILERLEQEALLNDQKLYLENLVKERTEELEKQNKEYASLNEEYLTQNEELIVAKEKAEESNQLKTRFINNMSHEIRTPMNAIIGFSTMIKDNNYSTQKRNHFIDIIQSSSEQLLRIIDDILEISRLETKKVKPVFIETNLNDLMFEMFNIFELKAKEQKISLYLKKGLPNQNCTIKTDDSKLKKIISNLLENALKFTYKGFIEFGYKLKNDKIVIFVKDSGIGIAKEKQDIIFERFAQEDTDMKTSSKGLGLGLSIVKENAELINGTVTMESEKDKGSVFYIEIPYNPVQQAPQNGKETIEVEKQYRVVLVEDEEVNFLYLEELLENIVPNIDIIHAKNGQEAVDLCTNNSPIDLVLLDIKLPVMNGYEAARKIKKIRPNLNIIAQTAYSLPEDKAKAMDAGCADFISKPISMGKMKQIMQNYLITN